MADLRVSTTDPDASPMQHKNKSTSRLGYQTHYVVDGGKARVILDVLVTPAEVTENLPMLELLFRSRFRWHLQPRSVTADAAYGTTENIAVIEKAGIRAYMALVDHEKRTSLFGRDAFTYDAEKDLYTCPKGELLLRKGYDHRERSIRYAARPSVCNACSLKARCTWKRIKGRWIRRSFDEEYLERARAYRDTEPYRKAMRKRALWVEPLFGEAKDWHGLRRFRLRQLEKVNTEALLKAAGQNVKRLLAFGTRGPKGSARVVALRQPAPNLYEFRSVRRHRTRHSRRPGTVFQHAEEFSEVRIAAVQHPWASLAQIGCLEGYYLDFPDFLIIRYGPRRGGSWPIGPVRNAARFGLGQIIPKCLRSVRCTSLRAVSSFYACSGAACRRRSM